MLVQRKKNISAVYKDSAPAIRTVKKWFAKFRTGDFNVEDRPRSGRPSEVDNDVIKTLVESTPRITTQGIAEKMNIDNSTALRHLKQLGYVSKLDTRVPQPEKLFQTRLVL